MSTQDDLPPPEPVAWFVNAVEGLARRPNWVEVKADEDTAQFKRWALYDPSDIAAAIAALTRRLEAAEADALRYRYLRPRLFSADCNYGEPPVTVITFRWPETVRLSADLDECVNEAIAKSTEGPKP